MDLQLLDETLAARGEPPFRARQVWRWAASGVGGYEGMTNLPPTLREALARELPFSSLVLREEAHARDGTVKALFETADGRAVEAVLMRYRDAPGGGGRAGGGLGRRSICVSSQSGCPLTCTFCATGSMRFARNLTASEIVDQALHFRRIEPIDHCVFMGMGEPMLNLDAVLAACERLPDIGVGNRRTTISTVGWIPGIERLAESELPVRLALSLHAAEDALRSQLMPVNERYPLAEVIDACRAFYARKRRRVFIEYVMLGGVNDRYEQALALARLLGGPAERRPLRTGAPGGRPTASGSDIFKVNLIPYNPTGAPGRERYRGSSRDSNAAFRAALAGRGIEATVRLTRGRDIAAACGQLAAAGAGGP
ncbi:MAG TPA: 23S rRNA (adenine(2503)-C(2))-methyltransferase RlmN [Solirubrobacteraceae bacterium]|nr:23S rRNA (adenine(2503)-C(2))-methyltransferase RlmN [Solirubrobacteraceae bacterium]